MVEMDWLETPGRLARERGDAWVKLSAGPIVSFSQNYVKKLSR